MNPEIYLTQKQAVKTPTKVKIGHEFRNPLGTFWLNRIMCTTLTKLILNVIRKSMTEWEIDVSVKWCAPVDTVTTILWWFGPRIQDAEYCTSIKLPLGVARGYSFRCRGEEVQMIHFIFKSCMAPLLLNKKSLDFNIHRVHYPWWIWIEKGNWESISDEFMLGLYVCCHLWYIK